MPVLTHNDSSLFYTKSGSGDAVLLFHGFGQDHHAFDEFQTESTHPFTFYAFDLFFHGGSSWRSSRALEKADWKKIMTDFLTNESITRFSIVAYSMGGKFALATLESFPDRISNLFLIAPDGVHRNFWYSFATWSVFVRRLFKSTIRHPRLFQSMADFLFSIHLINKSQRRFALSQMNTEEKRRRVYESWVQFRHLRFSMGSIAGLLNTRCISLTIILGRHDQVIKGKDIDPFTKKIKNGKVYVLDTGHSNLIAGSATFFHPV